MSCQTKVPPHPLGAISFGNPDVTVERRDDGTIYLQLKAKLGDYPRRITDRLHHWVEVNRTACTWPSAMRGRGWREVTYAQLLQ
jgi:feruloyl-CoA synthase